MYQPIHQDEIRYEIFDMKFLLCTKLDQYYIPAVAQSTMMGQSYSVSIEGL